MIVTRELIYVQLAVACRSPKKGSATENRWKMLRLEGERKHLDRTMNTKTGNYLSLAAVGWPHFPLLVLIYMGLTPFIGSRRLVDAQSSRSSSGDMTKMRLRMAWPLSKEEFMDPFEDALYQVQLLPLKVKLP